MTSFAGQRVMVVEDIFALAMEVQSTLESVGVEVIGPFANSANALKGIQQVKPDCAMLDVNLGEDNSFDLARTLRMRGVPFLFFTGYDRKALPPEFADVERLEKPIDPTRLLQALGRCCRAPPV